MGLPVYLACLLALSAGSLHAGSTPWDDPDGWIQDHEGGHRYREMSDEAVRGKLKAVLDDGREGRSKKDAELEFEGLLNEASRRGGKDWQEFLAQALKQIRGSSEKKDEFEREMETCDLEVLTALRRSQGKAQPLLIQVAPLSRAQWEFPVLPVLAISARRDRDETEDFRFTFGGDYRTGRQVRWTVLVWDGSGAMVPRRGSLGYFGGGIFNRGKLSGEVWESTLTLESFIKTPPKPGRYHAVVAYHDSESIADMEKIGGYVTSYSAPFEFEIVPRVIDDAKIKGDEVMRLAQSLPARGKVKVLSASYTKGAHDFIDPKSPAGKLLAEGWPVVPVLIRQSGGSGLNPTQRAWVFGILHSITGCKDPTETPGVVGPFAKRSGGFWINNTTNGEFSGAGGGFGGTQHSTGDKIDDVAQRAFLKEWEALIADLTSLKSKAGQSGGDQPVKSGGTKAGGGDKDVPGPRPGDQPKPGD